MAVRIRFIYLLFIILISFGAIGGCGGGNGNGFIKETVQVSGEVVFFQRCLDPFCFNTIACSKINSDNGMSYWLIDNLSGINLSTETFVTVILNTIGEDEDFDLCGGILVNVIDVLEKTCLRTNNPDDLCLSPEDICCPFTGCVPDLNLCPTPSCPSDQKACSRFCVDKDRTCCPDPKSDFEASCISGTVCCPKCEPPESGILCAFTLDDCFCVIFDDPFF